MSERLTLQPVTYREACRFIAKHHRHHKPPQGCKFCIGVSVGDEVVGVVVVGRPIACSYDDGWTAEVTRCCTDGTKNACSMLYGAAWRACRAMGYMRLITYTRTDEEGVSLNASGWEVVAERKARSWERESGRPRIDMSDPHQRLLWQASPAGGTR